MIPNSSIKYSTLENCIITEEIRLIAERELGETEEKRRTCLQTLKQLLSSESNNLRTDEEFLIRYLRARKFNCKDALKLVKKYYAHREAYPELYSHFTYTENLHVLETNVLNYLPLRSPEGRSVWVSRFGLWDPSVCTFDELLRFGLMCNEKSLENPITQICGMVSIVDMKGLTWSKLLHVSISSLKCFVSAVQDCLPMRHKAIHVINNPKIFHLIFMIMHPWLKEKIRNRIHFHGSDLDSLHQHLPKEMLPEEFGGTNGTFENEKFYNSLKG